MSGDARPGWRSVVLDTTDARALAEFYRQLLGYDYQAGDEAPPAGQDDPNGRSWLMLQRVAGGPMLAFQQVEELPASTWPGTEVPQQLHLDFTVPSTDELARQHAARSTSGHASCSMAPTTPRSPFTSTPTPTAIPSASSCCLHPEQPGAHDPRPG